MHAHKLAPLFSIIIPTKNRYHYLEYLINYFHSLNSEVIELVIQDNSNQQSTEFINKIKLMNDGRIVYLYNANPVSVIENCDAAVKNSNGEFLSMIGDDDGFLPEIIDWVQKMKNNQIDAIIPRKAHYYWPDIINNYHSFSGIVSFHKPDKDLTSVDCKLQLNRTLQEGGFRLNNLPRIYHGIVSRKKMDEIYTNTGSYFPGPSPDMSNAIALALYCNNVKFLNRPIIISGNSFKSTAGQGMRSAHVGKIEDIAHLPSNTALEWEKFIPKIWTGETIYAESIIKSLRKNKQSQRIIEFNKNAFYGVFLAKHPDLLGYTKNLIKGSKWINTIFYYLQMQSLRIKTFIKNIFMTRFNKKNEYSQNDISNIVECITYIAKTLKEDDKCRQV